MKPPDILLQCNSPKSLASTMADIDQDIDPFQTIADPGQNSVAITNYGDTYRDTIKNETVRSNHDKLLSNDPDMNRYDNAANPKVLLRNVSFSTLDGDPLPITIQTLLQDLGDTELESPSRMIFDENILNDDEISRNLNDWAMA